MAVKRVRVRINGAWVELTENSEGKYEGSIAAPNTTSWNLDGHYYPVTVEAEDMASNIVTADDTHSSLGDDLRLFVREITKPTIAFTAPASGAHLPTNTPQIAFQLRDESNGSGVKISTLAIRVDGGSTITNTSPGVDVTTVSGGYSVTYTPQTALDDGEHTVTVNIEDNDGNLANQASRSFVVDTVPPELNITAPSEELTYQNVMSLLVEGTTNDNQSSSVIVEIALNGGIPESVPVDTGGNFSATLTLTEGTNTILITATDKAGKVSDVERTVIVDTAAPTVNAITIVPNPVNVGQSYVITVDVTDD